MAAWATLVGEHGLISIEPMAPSRGGPWPGAELSALHAAWRATHGRGSFTGTQLLAAAGAHGLVPRPGTGRRFTRRVFHTHLLDLSYLSAIGVHGKP